jgi:Rrf2 family protein
MMLDIARHGGETRPVSLGEVAERTDISRGYLEQVAISLRSARLIRGVPGRQGGYRLPVSPKEITICQVVEALIGPISVVDCVQDPATCPRSDYCECRIVYRLINERIADVLKSYSLADLMRPDWVAAHGELEIRPIRKEEWSDRLGCTPAGRKKSSKEAC